MKKNKLKRILSYIGVFLIGAFILTSCNSFCSALDSASYRYAYDPINTLFFESEDSAANYILNTIKRQENISEDDATNIYYSNSENSILTLDNINELKLDDIDIYEENASNYDIIESVSDSTIFSSITPNLKGSLYYITSGTYTYYVANTYEGNTAEISFDPKEITFSMNSYVLGVNNNASTNLLTTPIDTFWNAFDNKVIEEIYFKANEDNYLASINDKYSSTYELFYGYPNDVYDDYLLNETEEKVDVMLSGGTYTFEDGQTKEILGKNNSLFSRYGRYKYVSNDTQHAVNMEDGNYWEKIIKWNDEIYEETSFGYGYNMSSDYLTLYRNTLDSQLVNLNSCITISEGFYGHINDDPLTDTILITDKSSWGEAWEHGFLEGLLVYPISYMVEYFSHAFGMNGWGQIGSVLLVTLIVRGIFMLLSFRSTLSQQKMQYLQPEIAKLQEKYPNSNTNEYEKQRLAQAQMNLYKRYKVHPFSSLIVLIFQFPIFIAVWNAMRGAASLSVDAVLGLRLSDTISNVLFTWSNWPGAECWTALVLIILMSGCQIVSMLLPQWLSKARMKNIPKMHKNPAANSSQKQMKIVSWVMTAFIIIMGFTLPAAMGVYWLAGALFSMIQTTIMHFIMVKHKGGLTPNNKVIDTTKKKKSFKDLFKKKEK